MSLGNFEVWGLVADGFQILLIALMILLLIRSRKRTSTPDRPEWVSCEANPFRHEFLVQSMKHQTELAFDQVEKSIRTERLNLRQFYESVRQTDRGGAEPPEASIETTPFDSDGAPLAEEQERDGNPYREVLQLAAGGANAHRIAKQLSIPRGEVELVLKMTASSPTRSGDETPPPPSPRRAVR